MTERFPSATRTARRDGRDIVRLTPVARHDGYVIESEVHPLAGRSLEPVRRVYSFATPDEATAFVEESLQALAYLGCDVG